VKEKLINDGYFVTLCDARIIPLEKAWYKNRKN